MMNMDIAVVVSEWGTAADKRTQLQRLESKEFEAFSHLDSQ
jgi:hypothetical protein